MLDPSAHNGLSAKMGLDATQSLGATEKRLDFSDAVLARVREQIAAYASTREPA
jgi:hypothetical protein